MRTEAGGFAQVPRWLLRSHLSDGAKLLYAALADRADNESDTARFSRVTLARDLGLVDVKSVTRRMAELEENGVVVVTRSKGPGGTEVNQYLVLQVMPKGFGEGGGTNAPRGGGGANAPHLGAQTPSTWGRKRPAKKNHLEESSTRRVADANEGVSTGKKPRAHNQMFDAIKESLDDGTGSLIGSCAAALKAAGYEPEHVATLGCVLADNFDGAHTVAAAKKHGPTAATRAKVLMIHPHVDDAMALAVEAMDQSEHLGSTNLLGLTAVVAELLSSRVQPRAILAAMADSEVWTVRAIRYALSRRKGQTPKSTSYQDSKHPCVGQAETVPEMYWGMHPDDREARVAEVRCYCEDVLGITLEEGCQRAGRDPATLEPVAA